MEYCEFLFFFFSLSLLSWIALLIQACCEKSDGANKKEGTNMSSIIKALGQEHNNTIIAVISHFLNSFSFMSPPHQLTPYRQSNAVSYGCTLKVCFYLLWAVI